VIEAAAAATWDIVLIVTSPPSMIIVCLCWSWVLKTWPGVFELESRQGNPVTHEQTLENMTPYSSGHQERRLLLKLPPMVEAAETKAVLC
jgi:hypothetical protein